VTTLRGFAGIIGLGASWLTTTFLLFASLSKEVEPKRNKTPKISGFSISEIE